MKTSFRVGADIKAYSRNFVLSSPAKPLRFFADCSDLLSGGFDYVTQKRMPARDPSWGQDDVHEGGAPCPIVSVRNSKRFSDGHIKAMQQHPSWKPVSCLWIDTVKSFFEPRPPLCRQRAT